jgi:hypothetical protein
VAKAIVDSNGPEDQAFILRLIDGKTQMAASWTSDKTALLNSLSVMNNARSHDIVDTLFEQKSHDIVDSFAHDRINTGFFSASSRLLPGRYEREICARNHSSPQGVQAL